MDVIFEIFYSILWGLGASVYWVGKGFKTSFNEELFEHKVRNGITATLLIVMPIAGLIVYFIIQK